MASARRPVMTGGSTPEFVLQEFRGINNNDSRENIGDDEFWWLENLIPLSKGTLTNVGVVGIQPTTFPGEQNNPSYTMGFLVGSQVFLFAAFANSGNGWITTLGGVANKIVTGLSSFGGTYAVQYGNQGLLIVDPNGYWDYNVTTPGTLTSWVNSVSSATNTFSTSVAGGTQLKQVSTVTGTGATFQAAYKVTSVVINAAGTGYVVGDSLTLTDNNPTTPAQIIVAQVGGGGAITAITLPTGGSYPGPTSSTLVATGPTGNVVSGGTGTGATFTTTIQATALNILNRGHGYSGSDTVADETAAPVVIDTWKLVPNGLTGGTGLATYAGRVWISSGRTVFFTDINSYNSFGGAGGNFTINDSYLTANVTCLFAANNYLYIFGDSSIDALSNVTITAGLTSFTRINITASLGTSAPTSVFSYFRAVGFYHVSGIYLLSGATPERISDNISGLIRAAYSESTGPYGVAYGATAFVKGELCAAMQLTILDSFNHNPAIQRSVVALYFRGKWWVYSMAPTITRNAMVSVFNAGLPQLFLWGGAVGTQPNPYVCFGANTGLSTFTIKTKLWDGNAPLREKQTLNAAIGASWTGALTSGVSGTVDTELASFNVTQFPVIGSPTGYQLAVQYVNGGGSQYTGLTLSGSTDVSQINLIALKSKTDRDMLT